MRGCQKARMLYGCQEEGVTNQLEGAGTLQEGLMFGGP